MIIVLTCIVISATYIDIELLNAQSSPLQWGLHPFLLSDSPILPLTLQRELNTQDPVVEDHLFFHCTCKLSSVLFGKILYHAKFMQPLSLLTNILHYRVLFQISTGLYLESRPETAAMLQHFLQHSPPPALLTQ